jgi:hypothetical protein
MLIKTLKNKEKKQESLSLFVPFNSARQAPNRCGSLTLSAAQNRHLSANPKETLG